MDSYPIARLQPLIEEPLRQCSGRLIQCPVGYLSFAAEQCRLLRAPLRLTVKSVTQVHTGGIIPEWTSACGIAFTNQPPVSKASTSAIPVQIARLVGRQTGK
jgi:hypothetical protein